MWTKSSSIAFALLAARLLACGGETGASTAASPAPVVLAITNVAQFFGLSVQAAGRERPVCVEGVVTRADPAHHLLVRQDVSGALALDLGTNGNAVESGAKIRVEAEASMYRAPAFADYPSRPWSSEVLESFETRTNCGNCFLTRTRAFLRPPSTGGRSTFRDRAVSMPMFGVSVASEGFQGRCEVGSGWRLI